MGTVTHDTIYEIGCESLRGLNRKFKTN